jgi:hypothetical protein
MPIEINSWEFYTNSGKPPPPTGIFIFWGGFSIFGEFLNSRAMEFEINNFARHIFKFS